MAIVAPGGKGGPPFIFSGEVIESVPKPPAPAEEKSLYRASPILTLRSEPANPFRTSRRIATLGDVRDGIVYDLIRDQLKGADLVMKLGSFEGFLHPETSIADWKTSKKPDVNVVGDAATILRNLAPLMGWNPKTLERNLEIAQTGMVYYNVALETPVGPVPFKLGVLDREVWRRENTYFDHRASLLDRDNSYEFLNEAELRRGEFQTRTLLVQTEYMKRALESFVFKKSFLTMELVRRRYRQQFTNYENVRIAIEGWKGKEQLNRYRDRLADIIFPPLKAYLEANPDHFEIRHPSQGELKPGEVTAENFLELVFTSKLSFKERRSRYWQNIKEAASISKSNWNHMIGGNRRSNATSRKGPHQALGFNHVGRKVSQLGVKVAKKAGIPVGQEIQMPDYHLRASRFSSGEERLGHTGVPLDWNIIPSSYYPQDENDPRAREEIIGYGESEIVQDKEHNALIKGNNPGKFTLPIRGVPILAYRMMDALKSPAFKTVVVVGSNEVKDVFEAFTGYFQDEIERSGKRFILHDVGPDGGNPGENILKGLNHPERKGRMAVITFGDVPFADPHNMAYQPWRNHMDYFFGSNGRDMLLDFMGMNAHYQGMIDGVPYSVKEGNVMGVRKLLKIWDDMYASRKSVESGPWGKAIIFAKYVGKAFLNPRHPFRSLHNGLNLVHALGSVTWYSTRNAVLRLTGHGKIPWVSVDGWIAEEAFSKAMETRADFRAWHIDPKPPVDVDGIADYIKAQMMAEVYPYSYQEELDRFAQHLIQSEAGKKIPSHRSAAKRFNKLYRDLYTEILEREKIRQTPKDRGLLARVFYKGLKIGWKFYERLTTLRRKRAGESPEEIRKRVEEEILRRLKKEEKLGITEETLKRKGINPEILPFLDDGKINPAWLEVNIPPKEIENYRRSFAAYDNRATHAETLEESFRSWHEGTVPYPPSDQVSEKIQHFVLQRMNTDPEYFRGLVLEWGFDRIEDKIIEDARKKFKEANLPIDQIQKYFRQSTVEAMDTPLRRVLAGFKAVDVLRRYHTHLDSAEFQSLYRYLVEAIHNARQVIPGERWTESTRKGGPLKDGNFLLRGFFDQAQKTADRTYVRKVGESPPPYRARGIASLWPHSNQRETFLKNSEGRTIRADGPVWLPADMQLFSTRLGILPSRIPQMMAEATGVPWYERLEKLPMERMTMDRLLQWTNTAEGMKYFEKNHDFLKDSFRNRLGEMGPGLALGLGSLFAFENLADRIGLDPKYFPHERFGFVVGASHLVGKAVGRWNEVRLNRKLNNPFDFVTHRTVNAGGETAVQYSFHGKNGIVGGWGGSMLRHYHLYGGFRQAAWNGAKGLATFFPRTAWNMGSGLMASALADHFISDGMLGLEAGSTARNAIHLGAFFTPELYHLAVGFRGPTLFRSSSGMRLASRAFAVGFMADMAYLGVNRWQYGRQAGEKNLIQSIANEAHDQEHSGGAVDGAMELMAPGLAAWWDSHEFDWGNLSFKENEYYQKAEKDVRSFDRQTLLRTKDVVRNTLMQGRGSEFLEREFYTRVDFDFLRGENCWKAPEGRDLPLTSLQRDMEDENFRGNLEKHKFIESQIRFLQRKYRGKQLSQEDALALLNEANLCELRSDLAQTHQLENKENLPVRLLFDQTGSLRPGKEQDLLRFAFEIEGFRESEVLKHRRAGLALKIMQLQDSQDAPAQEKLGRLKGLAREVGIMDAQGNYIDQDAAFIAKDHLDRSALQLQTQGYHFKLDPSQ